MVDVIGTFRVNKVRMIKANIQYSILFLKERMLFIKVGGQFADVGVAGTFTSAAIGGAIGGLVGEKLKKPHDKKRDEKIRTLLEMSPDELIGMDKDNYAIPYNIINEIGIKKSSMGVNGPRTGVITIKTIKKEKFDIAPGQEYEECNNIVTSVLSDKLT